MEIIVSGGGANRNATIIRPVEQISAAEQREIYVFAKAFFTQAGLYSRGAAMSEFFDWVMTHLRDYYCKSKEEFFIRQFVGFSDADIWAKPEDREVLTLSNNERLQYRFYFWFMFSGVIPIEGIKEKELVPSEVLTAYRLLDHAMWQSIKVKKPAFKHLKPRQGK